MHASAPSLKQRLDWGQVVVGAMLTMLTEDAILPLLQRAGYHFAMLDCEHGTLNWSRVESLCRTGRQIGLPIMVRCHIGYELIRRHMDMGPVGITIPMCERVEQIETLRDAVFLPPRGRRGPAGPCTISLTDPDLRSWTEFENELVLIPQIETRAGIENLPALLSPPWIAGAWVGPYDLLMDLGLPLEERGRPGGKHHDAIVQLINTCKTAGKPAGMHTRSGAEAVYWISQGCRFIVCGQIIDLVSQQAKRNIDTISKARPA